MSATGDRFTLDINERHSPLWIRLSAHLNARLDELRRKNDNFLPEHETAQLRGRIAGLKEVLSYGKEQEPPKDGNQ